MNKFINIVGIGAISLCMLGSCSMDRHPLTSFSEETFYNDEANLELALVGLYRGGITMGVDYNVSDWWAYSATILLDGASDIGYDRRGFTNDIGKLTAGTITETNLWVQNLYQKPYRRISACCRFIDGLSAIENKTAEMERMEAEARFIRAVQ